jgi:hypothetical protein
MLLSFTLSLVLAITPVLGRQFKQFHRRQAADPCDAPCSNVIVYASSCSDDACFCPYAIASASACSSCLLHVDANPTAAADIGSALSICQVEETAVVNTPAATPTPTPTATTGSDPCDAPCANIITYASVCTDDACFCPYAIASASACSSCLLHVDANPSAAADIGSALSICQVEETGGTAVATTTSVTHNTHTTTSILVPPPAGTTSTTASTTPTIQVKSGAQGLTMSMLGSGYLEMVMFLAAVMGFVCAFC